ncbi:hypothetical protein [Serratia quinivorans]|uniref:hypothetical protein n=1 Tax=Serratia quinivorans TaxID=137545 RepID=UPI00217B0780|nr:hypothetical protein [Serratia quinivorans]CAI1042151.1 Uncharacterised protein [Serratia quinivorans]CAI1801860.1 Uncharacterised protein [Serratia quinivorans]
MNQTRDQQAYQRGIRAARLWKRLKSAFLRWDQRCVSKACEHKLPGWVGHIPTSMFAIIMLSALVFGGMIIASSAVLVGALVLLVSGAFSPKEKTNFDEDEMISPPYKSPSEYRADGEFGPGWYAGNYKVSDDY